MPKWLFVVLWFVLSTATGTGTGTVAAQEATPSALAPISTLEAGDFRALAVTANGDRLMVADAENQQVRIYDFNDPAQPILLTTLDVSGAPVLLAGGEDYGLVAESTDAPSADTLEVIAPPFPSPRAQFVAGRLFIDIAKNPHTLTVSPDQHWGIAVGDNAYTLLLINGVDDIESLTVESDITSVSLSDTNAYVLHGNSLERAPLDRLEALQSAQSLPLDGEPSAIALNNGVTKGVVVVDGNRLITFDPASMEQTGEFTVEGAPITSVHYLTTENGETLLLTKEGVNDVTLFDPTSADAGTAPTLTESLDNPIRALTTFDQFMIVTDGVTIRIFSA